MNNIPNFDSLGTIAQKLRTDLSSNKQQKKIILLFAHNGVGKTRLSMEFKDIAKRNGNIDTLYYNAFTEDLFSWDNDLDGDTERVLKMNTSSRFFDVFDSGTAMEPKIYDFLKNYVDYNFFINYSDGIVRFSREVIVDGLPEVKENIKISRGEENIFIWCVFLAICQLVIDSDSDNNSAYNWVKYLYIDDPISSLDDNHVVAVAVDLVNILTKIKTNGNNSFRLESRINVIISSHHALFHNIMYHEIKKASHHLYYLHKTRENPHSYVLIDIDDKPFFHHIATLEILQKVSAENDISPHHFNMLRSVLEKTAVFFGEDDIFVCFAGIEDKQKYHRAVQLFSHGWHSVFESDTMDDEKKELFRLILREFLAKYKFKLPNLL